MAGKGDNKPKYTDAKAVRVYKLRNEGNTWAEIQDRIGISADTAMRWYKKVEDDSALRKKAGGPRTKDNSKSMANTARAWIRKNPEGTHAQFVKKHGDISTSYFSTLRSQVKNGKSSKELEQSINNLPSDDQLREDNDFLRWWNNGERRGWVDRLLREVQE